MVRDIDAIVQQFRTDVLIEQLEIYALFQRLVTGSIKNVIYHLVEQSLLIDITVTNNLL